MSDSLITELQLKTGRFKADIRDVAKEINKLAAEHRALERAQKLVEENSNLNTEALKRLAQKASEANSMVKSLQRGMLQASKVIAAVNTFKNLAGSVAEAADESLKFSAMMSNARVNMDAVKAATSGMITEFEILKASSIANEFRLGLTSDQFTKLSEAAAEAANRMGGDVNKSIRDLIVGMARMSPKILDNLGIIINAKSAFEKYALSIGKTTKELSDSDKRIAFNNATMKALNDRVVDMGEVYNTAAARVKQASVKMSDAWREFKDVAIVVADVVTDFVHGPLSEEITKMSEAAGTNQYFSVTLDALNEKMTKLLNLEPRHDSFWGKVVWGVSSARREVDKLNESLGAAIGVQVALQADAATEKLAFSTMGPLDIINMMDKQLRPVMSDLKKLVGRKKKKKKGPKKKQMTYDDYLSYEIKSLKIESDIQKKRREQLLEDAKERIKIQDWYNQQSDALDLKLFKSKEKWSKSRAGLSVEQRNMSIGRANKAMSKGGGMLGLGMSGLESIIGGQAFSKKRGDGSGIIDNVKGTEIVDNLKVQLDQVSQMWGGMGRVAVDTFNMISSFGAGAFSSFVDGAWEAFAAGESLTGSLNKAFYGFLKNFGKEMQLQALKEFALAVAAAARYDGAAAGQHAAAGALFQAAAIAAGFGARASSPAKKEKKRGTSRGRGGVATAANRQMSPTTMTFNINSLVSTADEEQFARAIGSGLQTARSRGYA